MKNYKLIGLLAEKNISQRELAQMLGMNKNTVNSKINGKTPFDTGEATKICEILDITDNNKKVEIFLTDAS